MYSDVKLHLRTAAKGVSLSETQIQPSVLTEVARNTKGHSASSLTSVVVSVATPDYDYYKIP